MRLNESKICSDVQFFVKFINPEHLDELLNGSLYMNPLGVFIDQEKNTNERGQGDFWEGALVYHIHEADFHMNDVTVPVSSATIVVRHNLVREIPVFCFSNFTSKDFKLVEERNDLIKYKIDIPDDEKKKILNNFGSKAVIFPAELVEQLQKEATEQSKKAIISSVLYDDFTNIDLERQKKFEKNPLEAITWKDDFFKYQREARFAILNTPTRNPIKFKMATNIREKAIVVDSKLFLETFSIDFKPIK
ncbi:hypothetical protein [Pseudalkalibacillus hwajinpoensis]|uniref:hypothetical protein n=1 Tax=Guptibacillus hwajinpoensis TaxID=208199 RepID=UPI00384B0569